MSMVKLVDRYIGCAAVQGVLGVWAGMTLLFVIFSLLDELRDTQADYGMLDAFWFIALITPRMAYQVFPVSALLGALVALNPPLPTAAVALLAGLFGALHGLLNGAALAVIGAGWTSLLGIAVTVWVIGLLVSAAVVSLQAGWARVAVRVAGSWVAAVGILMFGWMLQ